LPAGFFKKETILLEGLKEESTSRYSFTEINCPAPENL